MEKDKYKITQAADMMGLSASTLRKWEKADKFIPNTKDEKSGHRYYSKEQIVNGVIKPTENSRALMIIEKNNDNSCFEASFQERLLLEYAIKRGYQTEIIELTGNKKQVLKLAQKMRAGEISKIIILNHEIMNNLPIKGILELANLINIPIEIVVKMSQ